MRSAPLPAQIFEIKSQFPQPPKKWAWYWNFTHDPKFISGKRKASTNQAFQQPSSPHTRSQNKNRSNSPLSFNLVWITTIFVSSPNHIFIDCFFPIDENVCKIDSRVRRKSTFGVLAVQIAVRVNRNFHLYNLFLFSSPYFPPIAFKEQHLILSSGSNPIWLSSLHLPWKLSRTRQGSSWPRGDFEPVGQRWTKTRCKTRHVD